MNAAELKAEQDRVANEVISKVLVDIAKTDADHAAGKHKKPFIGCTYCRRKLEIARED